MEVYFTRQYPLRSGLTVGNVNRILQGQADGQLTEKGIQQAQRLGDRLKNEHFDYVYCSDLGRCKDTLAAILAHHEGQKVVYEPLLREKGAGEYEGKAIGSTEQEARRRGVPFRVFKGGGGESWIDVNTRAEAFITSLVARHVTERPPASPPLQILVVSHGGWLMELRNVLRAWQGHPAYYANTSRNTALYVVYFYQKEGNTEFRYLLTNDASHLGYMERRKKGPFWELNPGRLRPRQESYRWTKQPSCLFPVGGVITGVLSCTGTV